MFYPIIYRVSTIQGGAGFRNHPHYYYRSSSSMKFHDGECTSLCVSTLGIAGDIRLEEKLRINLFSGYRHRVIMSNPRKDGREPTMIYYVYMISGGPVRSSHTGNPFVRHWVETFIASNPDENSQPWKTPDCKSKSITIVPREIPVTLWLFQQFAIEHGHRNS